MFECEIFLFCSVIEIEFLGGAKQGIMKYTFSEN